ncbi:MAG TPA: mechanosensitive ion channel family protein [Bryobacteraceae bacterium]|nr:mechanosensitive ion channel family protein [Bryobacteraceae bacterium]
MRFCNLANTILAACLTILVTSAFGQITGAPVTLDGRTLFTVRTSLGPFTAGERAAATSARVMELAKDLTIPVDAVGAAPSDTSTDIVARDRVLLTVTDADARAAGISRAALAANYVAAIRSAIAQRRAQYSYRTILIGALYTLVATLLLILLLWGVRRIFPALYRKLEASRGTAIRTVYLQRAELVTADRIVRILVRGLQLVRAVLVLTIFYVYIPLVLSFFPWTREYAPAWFGYIANPLRSAFSALVSYLPSLVVVVVAVLIAYGFARLSHFLFGQLEKGNVTWPGFYPEWATPTHKIVRFLILAFTLAVVFPYLPGSASPAFRGISIFLGVLFSLGSTSAVANLVAGTILTYTRAFQIGDRVRIADTVGDVVEKTLLATRVQTIKNEMVTVPNAMVLGSHITNFTCSPAGGRKLILHTTVTIGYDAPWRIVHDLLIAAALRTPGVLQEPKPFVLQTGLDDFYVHYEINGYTDQAAQMAVIYAELHENIQDCFNEAGVEIMSPHFSSLRDGNRKAIPDSYLPKTYAAPSFRLMRDRADAAAGS